MPTEMLTRDEHRASQTPTLPAVPIELNARRATAPLQPRRRRRLRLHVAAWALGTILVTTFWVVNEWQANGAFERFGHEGNTGEWNPTLWALVVGVWGLIVGTMALRAHFERPTLTFHVASWVLGMVVLTPLWALIEWQDNGGFERWSNNSRPGDWEPWILYVGGIWAFVICVRALRAYFGPRVWEVDSEARRLDE